MSISLAAYGVSREPTETMSVNPRLEPADPQSERTPEQEAAIKVAGLWVGQFARTLKTCRLYDGNNPTVIRFRDELAAALRRILAEHGDMTFHFTSDDVLFEDVSLYPARSRDDNLALPFHRDGVRALLFRAGIEPREVDALVDAVLHVTGQNQGQDDLVTMLWEAQLHHLDLDYVPSEGDVGGAPLQDNAEVMPWPTGAIEDETSAEGEAQAESEGGDKKGRSDDWSVGDSTAEIEAGYEELAALSRSEVDRFQGEFTAEHEVPVVTAILAIADAYLRAGSGADDRFELARFLPRVLRQAVTHGAWAEAREAILLLRECGNQEWSIETFAQELMQPISVSSTVEQLEQQEEAEISACVTFAREFGDPAVDWLCLLLAESQNRSTRRLIAETLADLCRSNPERLAPWLSDPRWYVVRNVVHILGWIGGSSIVGLLQNALRNPDPRVRHEVVAALSQVDPAVARPLLLRALNGADPRMFSAALHQLSAAKDITTSRVLLGLLKEPSFDERSFEEKRAIYSALAAAGGDEVLPELEAELHKGNWFARGQEAHRQAVARCIARIGTALSKMILLRGAQSRRGPVRKACEDALAGFTERD